MGKKITGVLRSDAAGTRHVDQARTQSVGAFRMVLGAGQGSANPTRQTRSKRKMGGGK